MKYFVITNTTTEDDLKAQYRELCKQHHPDTGGDNEQFVDMQHEYESAIEQLRNPATVSITENIIYKGGMAAIDAFLQTTGKGTLSEVMAEKAEKLIEKLIPDVLGDKKPLIKMMVSGQVSDVDQLVKAIENMVAASRKNKKRN